MVVGGGSAGWLTAGVLASQLGGEGGIEVSLVESPDQPAIGVGEGTWPSMRDTLRRIGVSEADLVRECDAAFKQGSKFIGWTEASDTLGYYHPFSLPHGHGEVDLVNGWLRQEGAAFAHLVSAQPAVCEAGLGPKQLATPEFAAVANYGYHLDAVKLGIFLRRHCVERLGVRHIVDHVLAVDSAEDGRIAALQTRASGALAADLFVDCTGLRSLLIGQHFNVPRIDCTPWLFNDRALALQVPYARPDSPVACQTTATAQSEGWIWDIGLPTRRGLGHVYSSQDCSEDAAAARLVDYARRTGAPADSLQSPPRLIRLEPGYRREAFVHNCVAVGLAGGFVEPLEASSLVMVEMAAAMLAEQFPSDRDDLALLARRFNESFRYRWQRVIDFLKLHYAMSRREDSDYWRRHRDRQTWTDALREQVPHWRRQPPSRYDFPRIDEMFPSASYQYVLYGMGLRPDARPGRPGVAQAEHCFTETAALRRRWLGGLPAHRALLNDIAERGLPRH
nr:tryptophan halogenase family protein [Lysobacter sp. CAU 1642]